MKLFFLMTADDILAFNRFHFTSAPGRRRRQMAAALAVPAMMTLVLLLYLWAVLFVPHGRGAPPPKVTWGFVVGFLAVIVGIAAILAVVVPRVDRWQVDRWTRRMLAQQNATLPAACEVELAGGRLISRTKGVQLTQEMRGIVKLVGNEQYTFAYITSTVARVIPRRPGMEREYDELVGELRRLWEQRDLAPPPRAAPADERIQ